MRLGLTLSVGALVAMGFAMRPTQQVSAKKNPNLPQYTKDGDMIAPPNYREWIFLTSGFDMTYRERAGTGIPEHSVFDNVFVNPEAYRSFLATGTWPDKTIMVLENRSAESKDGVIVKGGRFQNTNIAGLEIHVKDSARFKREGPGGTWGFFDVKDGSGKAFEPTASCFTCHQQHAAVDTTFVQFYPTLLPLAEARKTLSDPYLKDRVSAK
jgi:hypothetical protein